jgi:type I restriction enzyme S subunit
MGKLIPEGYKQTEVGVIPADWDISALGDLVKIRSGESPSCLKFAGKGFPYFKVDELNNSEKFAAKTKYFISAADKLVPKGSLIFPKRGASIFQNKIRILKNDSYMDTNLMTLTVSDSISNEYCYYQLNYIGLSKVADTTSVPQINNKHIKPFNIPFPLQLEEQQAIATALSDVDNLITSLEQLIEKKKAIKQGTMQELLTGKRRLKGFGEGKGYKQTELGLIPEDWEVVRLGDYCSITTGKKDVNEGSENGLYPFFTCSRTPSSSNSFSFNTEAILIAGNGDVGNLHYYKGKFEAYQRTYVVSEFEMSVAYIYHYLMNNLVKSLMSGTIGTSIPYIKKENLTDFSILLQKSSEEQLAIARVLSDMDSEIEDLETKVDKYKQIKQGMMQNLLTGRIRLV